jgi:hypothetical protein
VQRSRASKAKFRYCKGLIFSSGAFCACHNLFRLGVKLSCARVRKVSVSVQGYVFNKLVSSALTRLLARVK